MKSWTAGGQFFHLNQWVVRRGSATVRRSDAPLRDGPLKFTAMDLLRDAHPKPAKQRHECHTVVMVVTAFGRLNRRAEGQLRPTPDIGWSVLGTTKQPTKNP